MACRPVAIHSGLGDSSLHRLLAMYQGWRPLHALRRYAIPLLCCHQSASPYCVQGQCQRVVLTIIMSYHELYGHAGTIAKLGTKKHHTEFLPRLDTLDLPGCFGCAQIPLICT